MAKIDKKYKITSATQICVKDGIVKHVSNGGKTLFEINLNDVKDVNATFKELTINTKDGQCIKFYKRLTVFEFLICIVLICCGVIPLLIFIGFWAITYKSMLIDYASAIEKHLNKKEQNDVKNVLVTSNADELAKYKKLLDDGVISQDEFIAKKKQLLDFQ